MNEERKPIGKRLRFKVFNRDGFQCKYCGKTPDDDVMLEIDHINPVSKGGGNDYDNLITSCFDCNRGKADDELVSSPDNNLITLKQERMELEAAAQEAGRIRALEKDARQHMANLFCEIFMQEQVKKRHVSTLMNLCREFGISSIEDWIWLAESKVNSEQNAIKYICGIAKKVREQAQEEVA